MRVRIIVDSTADLAPELKGQVEIVPLTVNFGTEEYIDGITITHEEFYNKLIESDVLPTTSQAIPAAFEKVFQEVAAAGDSAVVSEHVRRIRARLSAAGCAGLIETVWGVGYRWARM